MSMRLTLYPGPRLFLHDWQYDPARETNGYVDHDVTEQASRHLFDTVALAPGVALRDIFLLLDGDPMLQQVFARDWAGELLAEIMESAGRITVLGAEYDPQGIEYLELHQLWHQDSCSGELQPIHRLGFKGVGFVLREDVIRDGCIDYHAGERIRWGVSLTSPRKLLHLPVRLNPEVIICEDNPDSVNHGKEIRRAMNPGVTLGQVLHGILWELSFHGAPEARDLEKADLSRLVDAVDTGTAITLETTDIFTDYKTTLAACFDETVGCSADELYDTLLKIGDRDPIEISFRERLGPVRLKAQFAGITGMELRVYIRRNSRRTL